MNVLTLAGVMFIFMMIMGGLFVIGQEALLTNTNLDSASIAEINNLDKDLYSNYEYDIDTRTIIGYNLSNSENQQGLNEEQFEKEYLEGKTQAASFESSYFGIVNVPATFVNSLPFIDYDDISWFMVLLVTFLSLLIGITGWNAIFNRKVN